MAPERAPAFQFYPKDFMADSNVVAMNLTELGAYMRLLCFCWLDQSLPADMPGLARLCRVSSAAFTKLWPALKPCFVEVDGRLVQPRMERERQKQEDYRAAKAAAGKHGGRPPSKGKQTESRYKADGKQNESTSKANESSPVSYLQSPISDLQKKEPPPADARSKRPIFSGQRLTVFEWMFDDCRRTLGEHLDGFAIDEWFFELDEMAVRANLVIPKRDGGEWLQSQLVAEAQRRGIPLRFASAKPAAGKLTTNLASALANIKREAV